MAQVAEPGSLLNHTYNTMKTNIKPLSRHGQLAAGKRKVSVVADEKDIAVLKRFADADRRPLSLYLAMLIEREAAKLASENN